MTVQGVEKKQCNWHVECDWPHIAGTTLLLIYLPRFHPKNRYIGLDNNLSFRVYRESGYQPCMYTVRN